MKNKSIIIIFVVSITVNIFFIWSIFFKDEPIISINENTVLTQRDLDRIAPEKYKTNLINSAINDAIFTLELDHFSIEGSDKDFNEISKLFPELGNVDDVDSFADAYYVYKLFKATIDMDLIEEHFKDYYGDGTLTLYEIAIFDTLDHHFAETIQMELENGASLADVEKLFEIKFSCINTPSIEEFLSHYEYELDEDDATHIGDVFHVMDEEGMHVLLINDSNTIEADSDQFINLYFSENFHSIKTDIMNTAKSKYTIKYH